MVTGFFGKAKGFFGGEAEPKPVPDKKAARTFHAVSIVPGHPACPAAHELVDRRFLSREAPVLPLKKCDRAKCECRYEHFDDRRKGPRRARELGVSVDGFDGADQRLKGKRGRRSTDR